MQRKQYHWLSDQLGSCVKAMGRRQIVQLMVMICGVFIVGYLLQHESLKLCNSESNSLEEFDLRKA